ncbi:MAG: arginine N-succinyltransferase [Legionella sp.]|uniref:arginine N-succinyltransferase n=1 Tax=Legionella sp. TaxID=459 RepID=UPI0039E314F8
MMLFRRALDSDLDAIHHLAKLSGIGMTTLPKDKKLLEKRIKWSTASYHKDINEPDSEYYFFVLENQCTKEIIGISGIESRIGFATPFYSYKLTRRTRVSRTLKIRNEYEVLSLVNDKQGHSELCTLFLNPAHRRNNNGILLSKGRFLFMAQHPQRFAPIIIADMRGVSDKNGNSPFWNNIGSHFFKMTFAKADQLTLATNKQFIADLMPRNPIYVKLLSPEAQAVIGQPHPLTIPAYNTLLREGFRYHQYIDIFDGGPTLETPVEKIKTVELSKLVIISSLSDEVSSAKYLLSNAQLNFRATIDTALVNTERNTCIISKKTAQVLSVDCGDTLRLAPLEITQSV